MCSVISRGQIPLLWRLCSASGIVRTTWSGYALYAGVAWPDFTLWEGFKKLGVNPKVKVSTWGVACGRGNYWRTPSQLSILWGYRVTGLLVTNLLAAKRPVYSCYGSGYKSAYQCVYWDWGRCHFRGSRICGGNLPGIGGYITHHLSFSAFSSVRFASSRSFKCGDKQPRTKLFMRIFTIWKTWGSLRNPR